MLMNGLLVSPATEPGLTMCPSPPCCSTRGTNVRTPCTTPQRFTPSNHCQSATVCSHVEPLSATPALLHTTSTRPNAATARSASACTCSAWLTSVGTASTL